MDGRCGRSCSTARRGLRVRCGAVDAERGLDGVRPGLSDRRPGRVRPRHAAPAAALRATGEGRGCDVQGRARRGPGRRRRPLRQGRAQDGSGHRAGDPGADRRAGEGQREASCLARAPLAGRCTRGGHARARHRGARRAGTRLRARNCDRTRLRRCCAHDGDEARALHRVDERYHLAPHERPVPDRHPDPRGARHRGPSPFPRLDPSHTGRRAARACRAWP